MPRFTKTSILPWALVAAGILASTRFVDAAELRPAGADRFFITPDQPSVLQWTVESGQPAGETRYTVRDYWGKVVASGQAKVSAGDGVEIAVKLGRGFYELELSGIEQRFGVVSLPAYRGKPDRFFAIDSALSWLVRDDRVREGLIRVLPRSGVRMSRERLSWPGINPEKGRFRWEKNYENVRRFYARHGVKVLEVFHNAPGWAGRIGEGRAASYPSDLVATAGAWRQIGDHWGTTWGALEVWNEPDIFFGGFQPADQYVPLVKTIAFALAGNGKATPVVGGVFAHYKRGYLDLALDNGFLDCVNAVSFHTYAMAPAMEGLIADYRSWLRAHGREAMPLWITECGRPWARGPDRPPADQDAASALDIAMKAVEARAGGVARYFAFVYPFFEERQANFGMMGRRATPLRSMAAYVQLASVLSQKPYLGDLKCDDAAIQRARVFGDERETLAVLYTGKTDAAANVKVGLPVSRIEGIDGRKLELSEDGKVPIPDGLTYVWLDRDKLAGRLQTDTTAARLWAVGQQPGPRRPAPGPIVLRFQPDPGVFRTRPDGRGGSAGYRILVGAESLGRLPLSVRVFNLSGQPRQLTLRPKFSVKAARVVGPGARTVNVPGEAFTDVAWEADLSEAFAEVAYPGKVDPWGIPAFHLEVTVTAEGDGAEGVLPLAFDLAGELTLAQLGKRYPRQTRLPIERTADWTASIADHGRMTMDQTADGHWRLGATFQEQDRWVYPYFRLPDEVDLARAKGLVLRARCRQPATVRVFLWEGDTEVGYMTAHSIIPADGKWHTAVVLFEDLRPSQANARDPNRRLDLDQVRRISIGMNSEAKENGLEVSDVCLIGKG